MKRKAVKKYEHGIFRTFPLFSWLKCDSCKKEFRRELGWRYLSGPFHGRSGIWKYVCKDCVPSKEDAHLYALKQKLPLKPKAPPPSPNKVETCIQPSKPWPRH